MTQSYTGKCRNLTNNCVDTFLHLQKALHRNSAPLFVRRLFPFSCQVILRWLLFYSFARASPHHFRFPYAPIPSTHIRSHRTHSNSHYKAKIFCSRCWSFAYAYFGVTPLLRASCSRSTDADQEHFTPSGPRADPRTCKTLNYQFWGQLGVSSRADARSQFAWDLVEKRNWELRGQGELIHQQPSDQGVLPPARSLNPRASEALRYQLLR